VRAQPGTVPLDVRPIPGMKFEDFVDGFRQKGFGVVQALNEVAHPSAHATGPHWHIVLDDGEGELPANAKILRLGGGGPDTPPSGQPRGWQQAGAGPAPSPAPVAFALAGASPRLTLGQVGGAPLVGRPEQQAEQGGGGRPAALPFAPVVPPPPSMSTDIFKARAGAIASDPDLSPDQRLGALQTLAREGGYEIPEQDLREVAENGLALVELQGGQGGSARLNTLRARPPAAPQPTAPGKGGRQFKPGEKTDPRLAGINGEVRALINKPSPDLGEILGHMKARGVPEDVIARLVPDVRGAIRFRREHGGAAYTGHIKLDNVPDSAPVPEATEQQRVEQFKEEHPNQPQARDEYRRHFRDMTVPERVRDVTTRFAEAAGHHRPGRVGGHAENFSEDVGVAAELTPVLGGAIYIDRGIREAGEGHFAAGALTVALGSLDALGLKGAARAGLVVVDKSAVRQMVQHAGGDVAKASEAIAAHADEVLASGGTVTLHVGERAVPITGRGLTDAEGNAWDAVSLLSQRGSKGRLEIQYPEVAASGSRAAPAGGSPAAAADDAATVVRQSDGAPSALPPGRPVRPDEVAPIPGNRVESAEEAAAIPSRIQSVEAPNEAAELASRRVATGPNPERTVSRRGPVDLSQRVRQLGGLRDDGGELASMGIGNTPRRLDFGSDRGLAKLVNNEGGLSPDEATLKLWEEGWFPNHPERPSPGELFEALKQDSLGRRTFHPDDADEVARFEAAAGERARVERAAEDGSPLADDVGQPIAREDLDTLEPPASAYEDAPRLVGRVGNLNLERVENPEEVTRLVQRVREMVQVDNRALDRVTNEELKALARDLNMTPEKILARRGGRPPDAAEAYATRVIVHQGRQKLAQMARKARGATDEDLARFHNMVEAQVALERQLAGEAAAAGRVVQQFNALVRGSDDTDQAIKAYLRAAGSREHVEDIAEKIIQLSEDPAKVGRFVAGAVRTRKRDMLNELYINSLLSGPQTHIVNMTSNTAVTLWALPEHALTAIIGRAVGTTDRARLGELSGRIVGMIEGARAGFGLAKQAWRTGMPLDGISRVEARNWKAIPNFGKERTVPAPLRGLLGEKTTTVPLGSMIRTPTRALTAMDELAKSINRQSATRGLAYRRAMNGPGTVEEKLQRYVDLVNDPDAPLRKAAQDETLYNTLQTPMLTAHGRAVQNWANEAIGAKLIIPFPRSATNLLKWALARNPVGAPLLKEFRDAVRAGGNARNEAIARLTLGTGVSTMAVMAAMGGHISGAGPSDPKELAALKNSGWAPYSVRVGDEWVSYRRFDPVASLVSIPADFAEVAEWSTGEEADEIAMNIITAFTRNAQSKTWLKGPADFVQALSDPERHMANYVSNTLATIAVPVGVSQAANALDPEMRNAQTLLDKIRARIPGLSRDVDARLNVWGEPIKRSEGLGPDGLTPIYTSRASDSALMKEVARLRLGLSLPQRSLRVGGEMVELTPEQHSYYTQMSGKAAKAYLEDAITGRRYKRMTDLDRADFIKGKLLEFRATARRQLRQMYPELATVRGAQRVRGRVKDGDTFSVDLRLQGADAFEVKQKCQRPDGTCSSCGQGARRYMRQIMDGVDRRGSGGLKVSFTGETTYGRPVANATIDGKDLGEMMIRDGWAVTTPEFLKGDPDRLRRYRAAEAEARQQRRGAHAFRFNTPAEYRHGRRLQCEFDPNGKRVRPVQFPERRR
jgi:endonuclease YncB( thermonuclease family)